MMSRSCMHCADATHDNVRSAVLSGFRCSNRYAGTVPWCPAHATGAMTARAEGAHDGCAKKPGRSNGAPEPKSVGSAVGGVTVDPFAANTAISCGGGRPR